MLSGTHRYFKAQGFESCPECGHWLLEAPQGGRGLRSNTERSSRDGSPTPALDWPTSDPKRATIEGREMTE